MWSAFLCGHPRQALTFTRQSLAEVAVGEGQGCTPVSDQTVDFAPPGLRGGELCRSRTTIPDELTAETSEVALLCADRGNQLGVQFRDSANRVTGRENAADAPTG